MRFSDTLNIFLKSHTVMRGNFTRGGDQTRVLAGELTVIQTHSEENNTRRKATPYNTKKVEKRHVGNNNRKQEKPTRLWRYTCNEMFQPARSLSGGQAEECPSSSGHTGAAQNLPSNYKKDKKPPHHQHYTKQYLLHY